MPVIKGIMGRTEPYPSISQISQILNTILTQLAGKSNVGHTHLISEVVNLQATLDALVVGGAPAASETVAGLAEYATQAETDTGTDDAHTITPLKLAVRLAAVIAALPVGHREKTGNVGDGVATQIDITHSWGTRSVSVEVFRNSSPWDTVLCDVSRPDTNTVRLGFVIAPTTDQYSYILRTGGAA